MGHHCFVQQAFGGQVDERWCSNAHLDTLRGLEGPLTPGTPEWDELTLYRDERLTIVFTPFDIANPRARVTFVGLTPGLTQLGMAVEEFGASLRDGLAVDAALLRAKRTAAFAGSMRTNLIHMLDGIGLAEALDIPSSAALFGDRQDLADSTSVICHAVFVEGKNYSGAPPVGRHRVLAAAARQVLAANLVQTPDGLVVPLGKAAALGVELSGVDVRRVLSGFPHPSGGNGHRTRQYAANRDSLSAAVRNWFS